MLIDLYNKTSNYLIDSVDANFILLSIAITMITSIIYFIVLGWIITRMEKTYFLHQYKEQRTLEKKSSLTYPRKQCMWAVESIKILLGILLLLAGLAMLILPGQGLITILAGLSLLPFPGKRRLELFLLSRKAVRSSLNWIRIKANKDLFIFDEKDEQAK